jgi:hypothetical protein
MTMTTLVLAAAHQTSRVSGFVEVLLFSGVGLVASLVLVHFGINLGAMG